MRVALPSCLLVISYLAMLCGLSVGSTVDCSSPHQPGNMDMLPNMNSRNDYVMSSGFLPGAASNSKLHYWYIETLNDSLTAPLVIYINGGTGCSTIRSILFDNGPFRVEGETLVDNEYSWTELTNILYIDTVVGVGFSYGDPKQYTDDGDILLDTYVAVNSFFANNPSLKSKKIYIAGMYQAAYNVVKLTRQLKQDKSYNIKGISISNGMFDHYREMNSKIFYGQNRGLWDSKNASALHKACCPESTNIDNCDYYESQTIYECYNKTNYVLDLLSTFNQYNMYDVCYESTGETDCLDDIDLQNYLSLSNVKTVLHVEDNPKHYSSCSEQVDESMILKRHDMVADIRELQKTVKVLLFAGDKSIHGNVRENERFFSDLKLVPVNPWSQYKYTNQEGYVQVGGFTKSAGNVIMYSILGSGSLTTRDKPEATFYIISRFFN